MELNQNPLLLLNRKVEELEKQKAQEAKRQKQLAQQKAERRSAFNSAFRKAEQKNKWVSIGYTDAVAQNLSKEEFLEHKAQELLLFKQELEQAVVEEFSKEAKLKRPTVSASEARAKQPKLTSKGKPFPRKKGERKAVKKQQKAQTQNRVDKEQKRERPVSKEESLERALKMGLFRSEKEERKAQQQLNELKKARKLRNKQRQERRQTTSTSSKEGIKHSKRQARYAKTKLESVAFDAFFLFLEEGKCQYYADVLRQVIKRKERTHRNKSQRKIDARGQTKSQRKRPSKNKKQ